MLLPEPEGPKITTLSLGKREKLKFWRIVLGGLVKEKLTLTKLMSGCDISLL